MSLSPLNRDSHFEHRAEAARQRRVDQENLERERMRHERELQLRNGDLRRREQALHDREDQLAEREGRLAERERDANTETAQVMAREIGTAVDHNLVVNNPSAVAAMIVRAADKARNPDAYVEPPTNPVARAIVLSGMKRRGEIVDTPSPTGLAAKIVAAAKRARGS